MRVTSFGSGSSGNALLVQSGATSILIDAGVPIRRLRAGLAAAGVVGDELTAILVSHEHHDHVRTLSQLMSRFACPVMATRGTLGALGAAGRDAWEALVPDYSVRVEEITVTPIGVPHDAAEPVGFVVDDGETQAAIFTDLGETPDALLGAVANSRLVVLEANYDEAMLARGSYPAHLKRRIRGRLGHLSNADCAAFLTRGLGDRTVDVWLAHLSENNNHPAVARAAIIDQLSNGARLPRIHTLPRHGRDVVWDAAHAREQPWQTRLPLAPTD